MNYRHRFHAANFADVLKHAVLLRLIAAMQVKEKGFLYLDTHAGRGGYDLAAAANGASQERAPEWPDGLGRVFGLARRSVALADYLAVVREFDAEARAAAGLPAAAAGEVPRFYPGSPALAVAKLRPQDRAMLYERHPEEAAALADSLGTRRRVAVQEADGYGAVRAVLPPPERRALVLLDPPFEQPGEWSELVAALAEGLRRLPAGVFTVWYPLTARARVADFYRNLLALKNLPPCLTVELLIGDESAGLKLWGCGVLVLNPPYGLAPELDELARELAPVLAKGAGAQGGVHWLVRES